MKEYKTIIRVGKLPSEGSWVVLLKDNKKLIEGVDCWWDDVPKDQIKEVFIMGLLIPQGDSYEFFREGTAVPGQQPNISLVSMKVNIDEITLSYNFTEEKQ